MSEPQNGRGALFAGGLAAILASTCCLGPLVLVALGFSGAWIGNLTVLEPYRPLFIGAALVALFFAWKRIYRPVQACKPGEVCAIPQVRATYKLIFWIVAVLVLAAAVFFYIRFYFVFGEGVKAGELNQIVYKGWVWKTYEGRLIQTGFNSLSEGGNIQSNEFNFSVTDKAVADSLMRCSGKMVELHYKEYNGALPWRGMQRYIVDDIVSVRQAERSTEIPIIAGGE